MNTLFDVVVALGVVALVVTRQMRPQKVDSDRRFWVLPLILGGLGLRDPQLVDHAHTALSVTLLVASLVAVLAMGTVWGWTVRIWRTPEGETWVRGTKATVAAWAGMIGIRIGIYATGSALGVHQSGSSLMLGIAVLLLVRSLVVNWRVRTLPVAPQEAVLH
ncbi:DUF1453 domain-containing protein [Kitasatospora sp. NPDC051170]|uniref:DUF1453 domain-containing protein n=1 Tax=Kitasatospora sp. NPDC051170 TaxID=3364056 RepID=UPI003788FF82